MTTIHNEKLQRDLMRAIAVRALMNASGDNCFCPVKKPTKFIVTLKPVAKVPNTDPFLNLQPKFSGCTCNTKSSQKTTLTADQIQVRNNTEALKGKTLLNAFRVLTNSKFITIDPKYNYGDNGILSPSCEKLRLSGGGWGTGNTDENRYVQAGAPAANSKTCECKSNIIQEAPERVTLSNCKKTVKLKSSQDSITCKRDRIYRLLQRSCYEKTLTKMPPKCHIVCPGEYVDMEKEKKRQKPPKKETQPKEQTKQEKSAQKPSKDRAELRKELEEEFDGPTCVEKAVGTSDDPLLPPPQPQKALDMLSWDPLKYFGLSCAEAKKNEEESRAEKSPCQLSMFPFPGIRKPETTKVEPDCKCPSSTGLQQPEKTPSRLNKFPCPSIRKPEIIADVPPCKKLQTAEPAPAITRSEAQQPPPCPAQVERIPITREKEVHYERKPRPPPDISNEIIAQQCNRIHKLEQQVNELRCELGKMKNEIIPPDDMLRCTALTSKLRELTALLADLKNRHAEAITAVIMAQKQAPCKATAQPTAVAPARIIAPPAPRRPATKAEQVQTCFADSYKDQLSQTNASFGWRPFIDEATQSSPPSTVRGTPKNTSSVPPSSHTSSAVSFTLPCRHNTGEIPLKASPSFCPHCQCSEYPRCTYVERNLYGEIMTLLQHHPSCDVLLSVLLQPNNLYHVNISVTSSGEPLGCIYATEQAINEAVEADVFNRFLTFFIVDARISVQQKDKILAHTFEFFKN